MSEHKQAADDGWFPHGLAFLYLEMAVAIAVSAYSLFMAFSGSGGFPGK